MPATPHAVSALARRALEYLPYLSLALLIIAISSLIQVAREEHVREQRTSLIGDALWLEQSLRERIERNARLLDGLLHQAARTRSDAARLNDAVADFAKLARGVISVHALDTNTAFTDGPPVDADTVRLARATGRTQFGPLLRTADGEPAIDLIAADPLVADGEALTLVARLSLRAIVIDELPWWFARRYQVQLRDQGDRVLVRSDGADLLPDAPRQVMTLDPPGRGLTLTVSARGTDTATMPPATIAAVLLSIATVASIALLRRELDRRRNAERRLSEETAFRRAMEDSVLVGLRARDLDGHITHVNPAFCKMVGYGPDELIGHRAPMPYWDPAQLDVTEARQRQVLTEGSPPGGLEFQFRRKDGSRLDALVFEAPLIDHRGEQTGWMGSVLDITEQRRAAELARQQDERLQASARLVTMGEMASTLAHELNQPLAAITSYNAGCLNRLTARQIDVEELREMHERIGRQAHRAGEIIRRVHDFVRRAEPRWTETRLNQVVRDALALLEPDARRHQIAIELVLDVELPAVRADAAMLMQVLINLARNAIDATLTRPGAARSIRFATWHDVSTVALSVTDHGKGIAEADAERLFEPFFTTKDEGMGMGLNLCRSIAELHYGQLTHRSEPDGGTCFTLTLPRQP